MSNNVRNGHDVEKQDYRQILDGECILVGDRWFPKGTPKNAIRKYRKELQRKAKRNARRRERRLEKKQETAREAQQDKTVLKVPSVNASAVAAVGDSPVQRMVKDAQWKLLHRNSYEIMFSPSEVLTWVLVLDLVSLLDLAVRFLWHEAVKIGEKTDDPEILREMATSPGLQSAGKATNIPPDIQRARQSANIPPDIQRARQSANIPSDSQPARRTNYDPPVDTMHRLACERRKLLCRSTVAKCPTPTDIRVAWRFHKMSFEEALILGGLLLDLECYLDNALVRRMKDGLPCIVGRNPGIRGWLRENCPELEASYSTLIRWKNTVKRLRQALEVPDPVPTAALLDDTASAAELRSSPVHVQPRGSLSTSLVRFPWEGGDFGFDSSGRRFITNPGYETALGWQIDATTLDHRLAEARCAVRDILAHAESAARQAISSRHPHLAAVHLCREILSRVDEREKWWRGPLAVLDT